MSTRYKDTLLRMQQAVVAGDDTANDLFIARSDFSVATQMNIYQHGYRVRLHKVVKDDFPALRHYVGEDTAEAWIKEYNKTTPSLHYNLDTYPYGFAAFVATQTQDKAAQQLAMLEGVIKQVYMMPESNALNASQLNGESLPSLRIVPRTASRLMAADYDVNRYVTEFRAGKDIAPLREQKTFCFVYRHLHNTKRADFSETEYALMQALYEGLPLAESLDRVNHLDDAAVQSAFSRFVSEGMLTIHE